MKNYESPLYSIFSSFAKASQQDKPEQIRGFIDIEDKAMHLVEFLKEAITLKDQVRIEFAVSCLPFVEYFEPFTELIKVLLIADWHKEHVNLVNTIHQSRDNEFTLYLEQLTFKFNDSGIPNNNELIKVCFFALLAINSLESENAIRKLREKGNIYFNYLFAVYQKRLQSGNELFLVELGVEFVYTIKNSPNESLKIKELPGDSIINKLVSRFLIDAELIEVENDPDLLFLSPETYDFIEEEELEEKVERLYFDCFGPIDSIIQHQKDASEGDMNKAFFDIEKLNNENKTNRKGYVTGGVALFLFCLFMLLRLFYLAPVSNPTNTKLIIDYDTNEVMKRLNQQIDNMMSDTLQTD